jgi:hypothetical protein
MASYRAERLAQQLYVNPQLAQRFKTDREGLFEEYGIPEFERAGLREGTPEALARIQLHPILCIHFLMGTNPDAPRRFSGELLDRLNGMPDDDE